MKKEQILEQLKDSFIELKEVREGRKKAIPAREAIAQIENELKEERRGGKRAGSGAKRKNRIAKVRGVKLTDAEYKQIAKKFGSFSAGVKSLLNAD